MKDKEKQREASRRHYQRNKEAMKARAKAFAPTHRARIREIIRTYLETHPCVDCGESDPIVLEFDHRDEKEKAFNIGDGVARTYAVKRIMDEIAKCDVRCANCHRRKTHTTLWS